MIPDGLGLLWDVGTIVLIGFLARRATRYRREAARWHRLAELNIRAHLIRSGEIRPAERLAARIEDGVIPAELLEKLGTLRPEGMARRRYSPGGYMPDPPPETMAAIQADLDRRIAAELARRDAAKMGENEATPQPKPPTEGNDHE